MIYFKRFRKKPVGVTFSMRDGGGCFPFKGGAKSFYLPEKGGGIMDYITWRDLIDIATLVIAVISL